MSRKKHGKKQRPRQAGLEEGDDKLEGEHYDEDGEIDVSEDGSAPPSADDGFMAFSAATEESTARKAPVSRDTSTESAGESTVAEPMYKLLSDVPWGRLRPKPPGAAAIPPLVLLHNEILDFCDLLSPTMAELQQRSHVTERVKKTITDLWRDYDVEVFGSELTKVFLPGSDVDMVVLPPRELPVAQVRRNLYQLGEATKADPELRSVEVIANARVPIAKLRFQRVQVDVSFSSDSGLKTGKYMLEAMEDYPPMRPLVLVLKYYLSQRDLNETFTGGMGSFMLQLMIIAYLQHHRKETGELGKERTANLGSLLLGFLRFYGQDLNYEEVGISVIGEGVFFSKMQRGWFNQDRPHVAAIENPLDLTMDVGRNSYCMNQIKDCFQQAYIRLNNGIAAFAHPTSATPSLLGLVIRPDPVLLSRSLPRKAIFKTDAFIDRARRTSSGHDSDKAGSYVSLKRDREPGGDQQGAAKRGRWSGGRREDTDQGQYDAYGRSSYDRGNSSYDRGNYDRPGRYTSFRR